ncbi:ABC transporter permease [Gordonibacter sp. 28C]|uniref:SufB/SufD family protein n=1 Tax=Gordonibacter sp. 28C TaxID=2078569 RepID=UPI000DF82A47|nr:SufD family Fe-S cluster assembly protein [Gordonibacter sp. 28C]RDB60432.1 ABC transporter permease [Gordonibacter sp. 28C]
MAATPAASANAAPTITLHHVNAMPAPTWHRLRVNETGVEFPADLRAEPDVQVEAPQELLGEPGAFETALKRLEAHLKSTGELAAASPAGAVADPLDQPALSAFQAASATVEASGSLERAFETGMGSEAFAYLREAAGEPVVIATAPGQQGARAAVRVRGVDGAASAAAVDVVAAEGSDVSVSIALDSPEPGAGAVGCSLRVFAGRDARVSITSTQTLDPAWIALDDTGMMLDERARADVRHTVLGAGQSYTGLAGDLRGEEAKVAVDTRYLGSGARELDFNYELRHHGAKTESAMNANGVLAGASSKTLRGTIDFVRGCKGASGQEVETVLIADERAANRTVPVILCGEDDVAGNHGATIGHVRPEQLLYLASRGLSPEAAEQLFLRATLEEAALSAPDDATRAGVARLGRALLEDFEEEIA